MKVHRGLDHLPEFRNPVLTIGSYDGVHHGHRTIISRLRAKARESDGESIILTFHPHPREVVFPNDTSLRLLNTLDEKIALLEETGIDHLIVMPFTVEFSQINPYKYVNDVLIKTIKVQHLIIGYDHKFGLNREGNIDLLKLYAQEGKFTVEEIPRKDVDDLAVSSTKIRNNLLDGKIELANTMLGAPYMISGTIGKGSQIAGALGFPTANCVIDNDKKLIPSPGTYAARASCLGKDFIGMLYIGKSPTLQGRSDLRIEMNLFDTLKEDLYGKEISIYPEKQIRSDIKFDSKKELIYNISQDKIEVEHYFKKSSTLSTVAILNYNGKEHLKSYLDSHSTDENHNVVLIDNRSTDGSIEFVETSHQEVQTIRLSENYGFAGGYNQGLKDVHTKYVALVNSDVRVTDNWLQPLIDLLERDETVAAVQPKILSLNTPSKFEYAGAAGGFIDILGYPFCRGRLMNHVEEDEGQYNDQIDVAWVSGAAFVIRTDLFKKAGGFDHDFFAHMEEIDLCWRLKKRWLQIDLQSIFHNLSLRRWYFRLPVFEKSLSQFEK